MNPFHLKYKQKTKKTNKITKPYKILTDCARKENNNEVQRKDLGPIEVNLEGQDTPDKILATPTAISQVDDLRAI